MGVLLSAAAWLRDVIAGAIGFALALVLVPWTIVATRLAARRRRRALARRVEEVTTRSNPTGGDDERSK